MNSSQPLPQSLPQQWNKSKWSPDGDTIWIFETSYVGGIDRDNFISKFCSHFGDSLDCFDEQWIDVIPIALVNYHGKARYPAAGIINHLRKIFDQTENQSDPEKEDTDEYKKIENEKEKERKKHEKEDKEWSDQLNKLANLAVRPARLSLQVPLFSKLPRLFI